MNNSDGTSAKAMDADKQTEMFRILNAEKEILFLDTQIRCSLGLDKANVDDCLDALMELSRFKMTALILKKHPHVVSTIDRLRSYVGNVTEWKLTEEQLIVFNRKAEEIRERAKKEFAKIMALFNVTSEECFDAVFKHRLAEFKQATANMSEEEKMFLVFNPPMAVRNTGRQGNPKSAMAEN